MSFQHAPLIIITRFVNDDLESTRRIHIFACLISLCFFYYRFSHGLLISRILKRPFDGFYIMQRYEMYYFYCSNLFSERYWTVCVNVFEKCFHRNSLSVVLHMKNRILKAKPDPQARTFLIRIPPVEEPSTRFDFTHTNLCFHLRTRSVQWNECAISNHFCLYLERVYRSRCTHFFTTFQIRDNPEIFVMCGFVDLLYFRGWFFVDIMYCINKY